MADRLIAVPAARSHIDAVVVDPILKACMHNVLDGLPAADAVPVVRCKDCKHWHDETGWCYHHSHFIGADGEACHPWESSEWKMLNAEDFCSYGERRCDNG